MGKRIIDVALYCTPERVKKGREIVIEPRETASAGNVVMTGQRELQECALDVLYRNGRLGQPKEARTRYNAGYWLRELYLKTHPSDGVGAYSIRLEGQRVFAEPTSAMMSEADDWNLQCLIDTAKSLTKHWRILEQLCCEDNAQGNPEPVWAALDALYDLREGYIEDYLADFEKAMQ